MSETPPVPECPSWCRAPAGHHTPTHVPGDWVRFHVAYRETFFTAVGDVLSPVHALHLLKVLGRATSVLIRINGDTAQAT